MGTEWDKWCPGLPDSGKLAYAGANRKTWNCSHGLGHSASQLVAMGPLFRAKTRLDALAAPLTTRLAGTWEIYFVQ